VPDPATKYYEHFRHLTGHGAADGPSRSFVIRQFGAGGTYPAGGGAPTGAGAIGERAKLYVSVAFGGLELELVNSGHRLRQVQSPNPRTVLPNAPARARVNSTVDAEALEHSLFGGRAEQPNSHRIHDEQFELFNALTNNGAECVAAVSLQLDLPTQPAIFVQGHTPEQLSAK